MRVLTVHNFYQRPGGEDVAWRSEARLLRSKGHQVSEYVRYNQEIGDRTTCGRVKLALQTIWSPESNRRLSHILRREKPQLVHFHNTFPLISPSAYYACREFGVPVVQTIHNYRLFCPAATFFRNGKICEECVNRGLWRSVRYACYRGSRPATATVAAMLACHRLLNTWKGTVECFIALSDFCRKKLAEFGIPLQKLAVKPNFLTQDPGCRSSAEDYALFVGRLSYEKGVATLVSAWKQLSRKVPLRILGDGPLRQKLETEACEGRSGSIHFEGWSDHEEVIKAIKGARFLVFPSEWYEGLPMTIVESFACGVPVVSSRLGTMAEIVESGRTGLHFTAGDSRDLAAKVAWAWDHPHEMQEMSRNARWEYEAKYTAERNYEQLLGIYDRVLALRHSNTAELGAHVALGEQRP